MNTPILRNYRLSSRDGIGVRCDADGAFVGGVPLLERSAGKLGIVVGD